MARLDQVHYFNEPVEKQLGFVAMVQTGKTLHLAGVTSVDDQLNVVAPDDMGGQIERVYDIIEATLSKSGATLADVVNEMIFVTDLQKFAAAGAVRAKRYAKCVPPAATAVQVSALFFPAAMVEIQVTATLR